MNSRPYNYHVSPDLPCVPLNDHVIFSGIGVDYSGTLNCKNLFNSTSIDEDDVFNCYSHMCKYERSSFRLPNASAETFINSLSKFVSRRGFPQIILSDNGNSFIAGITQNFVASKNFQWDFNFANASWSLILMVSLPY